MKAIQYYLFALFLGISLAPLLINWDNFFRNFNWFAVYIIVMGTVHLYALIVSLLKNKTKVNTLLYFVTPIITLTSILHTFLLIIICIAFGEYVKDVILEFGLAICVTIGLSILSVVIFRNENKLNEKDALETINGMTPKE